MTGDAEAAQQRMDAVRERIARACDSAGRSAEDVRLIGVAKRQPIARIAAAVRAGVTILGENYVQELQQKHAQLGELLGDDAARLEWRMIGALQRNKARIAVPLVDAVDSVDRASIAVELDKRARASGKLLDACLQVNVSQEPQKNGVSEDALPALLAECAPLEHLRVVGLMTVPAVSADPEASRPAFARLRELRDTLRTSPGGDDLRELSMGMSGDFEVAIEEGATLIRVGTALFGPRDGSP